MEISFQAVILVILYQSLGLDSFRNGNVHHDSIINRLQIDKLRVPKWNRISMGSYDRKKRFFEFNPVAFNKGPPNIGEDKDGWKQPLFSPFLTSLDRLHAYSKMEDPSPKFKSTYITSGEKPKQLKPDLDRFSGVKSFDSDLLKSIDARVDDGMILEEEQPVKGISKTSFLKSNSDLLTEEDERYIHEPHISWSDLPTYDDKNIDLNALGAKQIGNELYSFSYDGNGDSNDLYQHDMNKVPESYKSKDSDGSVHSESFKYFSGPGLDTFDNSKDGDGHYKETDTNSYIDDERYPNKGLQTFKNKNNDASFDFEQKESKAWDTDILKPAFSDIAYDFDFGSFGDTETRFDQSTGGFGHFKESEAKPYSFIEEVLPDEVQTFEQGFGSFSPDDSNCKDIDTTACVEHSDCSCFGLYQCSKGKCMLTAELKPGVHSEQTAVGQWHVEPIKFYSWGK